MASVMYGANYTPFHLEFFKLLRVTRQKTRPSYHDAVGRLYYRADPLPEKYDEPSKTVLPARIDQANLVSSLCEDGLHRPVIDLDRQGVQLLQSSTPGNHHLYFDKGITWETYKKLLEVLMEAKIVEERWATEAIKRGQSFVRPFWVHKP